MKSFIRTNYKTRHIVQLDYDLPIMANDRSNFFSLLEKLSMLGALTMSSDSLFHTIKIRTDNKSARALNLESGANNFSELPRDLLHYQV